MKNIKLRPIISRPLIAVLLGLVILSCDTSKFKKTPIDNFLGVWELQGRPMFEGIKIRIEKNETNEFVGKVVAFNEDKYVKMFVDSADLWVTGIKQSSNFEFSLIEKKIASELFALYGQDTKTEFKVQFIDKDIFGLDAGSSDPTKSTIIYRRIEK
jgi:hypothetical protein